MFIALWFANCSVCALSLSSDNVRECKLSDKVSSAVLGEIGTKLQQLLAPWLRGSSDISRMLDEDRGQLCIPCWAKQLAKQATGGQSIDDRPAMVGQ